ncbi:CDP-diacylglycerol--serine O-phosphatidyltransferase [Psittacicella gerlachiana]|uniref:PLD phosphodiesterase domain-containing protein n=1 Tax=Psittacicella gerlachiana TaxID=2028574 RepID=A0A3A1YQX0_9GAMM|nr:CDP-diacylglycerol--serine O-phosphatidyltransferase [Psittacicella gerlachiana]RIY38427.1 hypothetical protein CKF59_01020 [Psittacicella gerlachiana]
MLNTLINQGFIVEAANISLLLHPRDYQAKLLELIKTAKKRILINCLYLENDESGQVILQALMAAVKANPQLCVDVFLDLHRAQRSRLGQTQKLSNAHWYYQELAKLNQQLVSEHNLKRCPINIYGIPCNARELFGVYHIKGLVFDNTILYTGASINNNYCGYQTYRQDRYQIIEDEQLANSFYNFTLQNFSPALSNLEETKVAVNPFTQVKAQKAGKKERQEFKNFRQNVLLNPQVQYALSAQDHKANNLVPGNVIITPVFGIGKKNLINQSIFDAISAAREQITIYTPYFNFTKQLTKKLLERCRQGIKIRIILSDKVANDFYADPEDQSSYTSANSLPYLYELSLRKFLKSNQKLITQGKIEVFAWRNQANSYHAKGLDIDQKFYIWTGSNLNERSFNIDAENALIVYDPYYLLAQSAQHEMQFMLQHCNKLTSYQQIERQQEYPPKVKQTLRRARLFFIDKLAKRLF